MRVISPLFVSALLWSPSVQAADLQARTVAAFDRYVRASESQMESGPFLRVDALRDAERRAALDMVRRGELYVEQRATRDAGREIDVPGGLIHDWLGVAFMPGATLEQTMAVLQDYDRHAEIFRPMVARSKLLNRAGDDFKVYLRFYTKKVITVIVNSEHEAHFQRLGPDRARSRIYSTRIAEVADPDTPQERERPVGRDGGYLWRLNSYWRLLERDGGTFVQCEAISLTRGIPTGLGWLIRPFLTSIPRESLAFTLETTRRMLTAGPASDY
jgi:hypothetical protein